MNKKKILVVEDDNIIRQIFKEIFVDDYDVNLTIDANNALEQLKTYVPDLMIVDVMMPGVNGLELVKNIRKDTKFHKTVIIIVTALNDKETKKNAIKSGADDVVIKPFDIMELRTKVQLMFRLQDRLLDGCPGK